MKLRPFSIPLTWSLRCKVTYCRRQFFKTFMENTAKVPVRTNGYIWISWNRSINNSYLHMFSLSSHYIRESNSLVSFLELRISEHHQNISLCVPLLSSLVGARLELETMLLVSRTLQGKLKKMGKGIREAWSMWQEWLVLACEALLLAFVSFPMPLFSLSPYPVQI